MPLESASQSSVENKKPGFLDVYESAADQLPSGISDFFHNAARDPKDFAINSALTAGESAAFGIALSAVLPAGPTGALIGLGMTVPFLAKGVEGLWHAHTEADKKGANVHQIGHQLADSAVSNTYNIGLTFLGGWAGAEGGYKLADSDTKFGDVSRATRQHLMNVENSALVKLKPSLDTVTAKIPFLKGFGDSSAAPLDTTSQATEAAASTDKLSAVGQPKNQIKSLSLLDRPAGIVNNRVMQLTQTPDSSDGLIQINGLMHGHTLLSDGDAVPADFFAAAKKVGYDFVLTSEHDHALARMGVEDAARKGAEASTPIIGSDPQEMQIVRDAATKISVPGKFFADGGQEVGTIGPNPPKPLADGSIAPRGANHTGIYGEQAYIRSDETKPPAGGVTKKIAGSVRSILGMAKPADPISILDIPDGRFDLIGKYLDTHPNPDPVSAVLNHPRTSLDLKQAQAHDYGMSLFDKPGKGYSGWLANWGDKYVRGIEIIKGGALTKEPISTLPPNYFDLKSAQLMWDQGFHGGVTAGPDIHFQARIGEPPLATTLMAKSLDRTGVYEALNARHMSATSNADVLTVHMTANDGKLMMGDIADQATIGGKITPEVHIGGAITPDATYTVNLWSDAKTGDGKLAEIASTKTVTGADLAKANNTVQFDSIDHKIGDHSLYYAEVQRVDSKSPTYDQVVKPPKSGSGHKSGLIDVHGEVLFDHGIAKDGTQDLEFSTGSTSPEEVHALEVAKTAPGTPYPERAFTSPIFVEPITATHGLLLRGLTGTTAQQELTPSIQPE